ncbi:lysosomal Pro-X carboxypeptidase-like [Stegodyphus dumicola]|uniref:lysosomal Pro-X carboxypeptidase-like n=1 Tax=Stegodyphus dumicola TaxID=202533 RepID=UPI0015ADF1BE|nr:lysosomal Pro-X carboxypeptidase-like [Stegodyphus dumicola]
MNFYILLLICLLQKCSSYDYDVFFFKQKVDHFTYTNTDFFLQRYFVNSKYFDPKNGTVFFYTGNEGYIEMFANNTGFMWENAALFNALIVFAEHRYYGLSLPYGNESYKDNKHLGYLTTEQALADFANLIAYIKQSTLGARDAPVVAFGGSYGGMLAAWIRMKYPHLVDGAVASSAPILQFDGLADCAKFSEIVTNDFSMVDNQCALSIKKSWKVIRSFAASGMYFITFLICSLFMY